MSETFADAGSGSGKYRTLFELGQGGTANVSLAVARGPEGFKKLFVVKRLRGIYAQDPEFRAMFMTEARLSARLNHPHVVQVYEVIEQDVTPTILMEYIEGQTLDAVLTVADPKLPLELHLRILADVLSGLHYTHELRDLKNTALEVVHRDVSPHNVMISYEGVVKLLDFGVAKVAGSNIETRAGVVKGKLRYMPPEQLAGEGVDRRVDVFAVGVMLWEALSGTKLWQGLSEGAIMNRVLSSEIPEPVNPNLPIPPELKAICARALAPSREQRYRTALEFELAIEDYLSKHAQYVSARELGKFMSESFSGARDAISRRIEAEIARSESSRPPRASLAPRTATPSRTGYSASRSASGEPARSRLWMPALACLALGAAILAWGLRDKPKPATSPAPASPAPAAPAKVGVAIEARPDYASIVLDGAPVQNPYLAERVRDTALHVVRISAPGFRTEESSVRFDADVRIVTSLAPVSVEAAPSTVATASAPPAPSNAPAAVGNALPMPNAHPHVVSRPAAPSVVSASASASAAPAVTVSDACDPPYFWDQHGIKRFKPECL